MTEAKLEKKTLRKWRLGFGLTMRELAELSGCSYGTISNLENGSQRATSPSGQRVASSLGLSVEQLLPGFVERDDDLNPWGVVGYRENAPRLTLREWREHRALSRVDMARAAGLNQRTISYIEDGGHAPKLVTKRKLCKALGITPRELVLPGDGAAPSVEQSTETLLRAELRGARGALKKAYDFMRNDAAITFRYQDARDAILPNIEKELRGL